MRASVSFLVALSLLTGVLHQGLSAQTVDDLLARFRSADPSERSQAFFAFVNDGRNAGAGVERALATYPTRRAEIATALIELLRAENERYGDRLTFTEADAVYHGDLIWAVATLRDPRALEPLLDAIETGGLARRGVADLGDIAVPQLVEKVISSEDKWTRVAAAVTMGLIMERNQQAALAPTSTRAIRAGLLEALDDTSGFVRHHAVRALIHFADPDVRARMQALAQGDVHDPVREAAMRWLERHGG